MEPVKVIGLIAALVHLGGYLVYNGQIRRGKTTPNITTWCSVTLLSWINALSYYGIDTAAWYESGPPIVGAFMTLSTVFHTIMHGQFQRPTWREGVIFLMVLASIGAYYAFKEAAYSNYIVQVGFCFGVWPMMKAVYKNPQLEAPETFVLWTISYSTVLCLAVYGHNWARVPMPAVTVIALGSMAWLSRSSRKKRINPSI